MELLILIASIAGGIFVVFYILWILYLATMNLKKARDSGTLHPNVKLLGYPIFIVGYTLDILLNIFVMTIIFFDMPEEFTISSRMERYLRYGTGWRLKVARAFEYLLDPFDPSGDHLEG
jgi:hypothetical protein